MNELSTKTEKLTLQRVPWGADSATVMEIMARDGCVVLERALTAEQVAEVNRELDPYFGKSPYAANFSEEESYKTFLGNKTKRVQHCVARSKVYCDKFLGSPEFLQYAKALLKDTGWPHDPGLGMVDPGVEVAIMASQGIEMYPGQGEQPLHRDGGVYPILHRFGRDAPEALGNMMLALTDFTDEIGATRVIPGSNTWEDFDRPTTLEMTIPAEMRAGDVLFFGGKLVHGGGRNRTDKVRRSIATGITPYNMTYGSEEAFPFAVSVEQVREMPTQVQSLIGFRSTGMWRIDFQKVEDQLGL